MAQRTTYAIRLLFVKVKIRILPLCDYLGAMSVYLTAFVQKLYVVC